MPNQPKTPARSVRVPDLLWEAAKVRAAQVSRRGVLTGVCTPRYCLPMTQTSSTANHTAKVITVCNGGSKAMRAVCSCGYLGVRFAYLPAAVKVAKGKAQAEGAKHAAGHPDYQ